MDLSTEPVRGGYPPPGFYSLSGVDQVRAFAQHFVPRPPMDRLFGIEVTHGAPGTATVAMRASPWLQSSAGGQQLNVLVAACLRTTARTVAPPAAFVATRHQSFNFIRFPSIEMERFIGRGQVVMASSSRVTVEARVEDSSGRLVVFATGQFVLQQLDLPPPPAPDLRRIDEPTYSTPDPPARALSAPVVTGELGADFISSVEGAISRGEIVLPVLTLMGGRVASIGEGTAECVVATSEWHAAENRSVLGIAGTLAGAASNLASGSVVPQGCVVAQNAVDFHLVAGGAVFPDGRPLRAISYVAHADDRLIATDSKVFDADDQLISLGRGTMSVVPARDAPATTERILTTVLFADVVGSTPTAERLGDAKWHELLSANVNNIRKALAAERGREVKTEGDGVLATFDSPVRAVRCARAILDGARRLGLEMRAGIHLGEVEVMGGDVAGIAVHVSARVQSAAEPGSIFVTSTVREAMAGSDVLFASRGLHQLKGIADEWHLYSVEV